LPKPTSAGASGPPLTGAPALVLSPAGTNDYSISLHTSDPTSCRFTVHENY